MLRTTSVSLSGSATAAAPMSSLRHRNSWPSRAGAALVDSLLLLAEPLGADLSTLTDLERSDAVLAW